ncbi:MAG: hypothetical protein GX275_13345 [Clostridiales bacterium]|nr:hypothetical protein [Clostridiales bacterium]
MDFSSLVLVEKDKSTGFIGKELGSFEVNDGALYVRKFFVLDGEVNIYFDTNKDVEEWEYSAIYDLFNVEIFVENGFIVEYDEEEFNPTFILKIAYNEDYEKMKDILNKAIDLIKQEMENVFVAILGKEKDYE